MAVVPFLSTWSPGQGVVGASWLNTAMQGGAMLADLRAFTGLVNMTVQMIGFSAQGDGGQGTFCWSNNPGTDDGGVTCIVPYGVTQGCWLRQVPGYVATLQAVEALLAPFTTSVANIPALRAATSTTLTSAVVWVDGWTLGADGGEGMFWYNAADTTSSDNAGTIIVDASSRRWYRETSGQPLSLDWFGGTAANPDCGPAMTAAIASLPSNGGTITIRGPRTFATSVAFTYPSGQYSLAIVGTSADVAICTFGSVSGFAFNASNSLHSIHFRDITIAIAAPGGNTIGVNLSNSVQGGIYAQNDFTRVTFRGSDGGAATNYWTSALSITGWGNFNHDGCLFYGNATANGPTGVTVSGNPSGSFKYSLIHNFSNCGFFSMGVGINYGTYVQGVAISNSNFTNGTTDIYLPAGGQGAVQLSIVNSQFAGLGTRILVNAPIAGIILTNNLIFVPANQIGVALNAITGQCAFTGNVFSGMSTTGSFGIVVASTGYTSVVTGNCFYGLGNGISLQGATTGGWNVALNNYQGTVNTVTNIGTNSVGVITQ